MTDTTCPIWGTPATTLDGYQGKDGEAVHSERAGGKYFISRTAKAILAQVSDIQKIALTHEICDHNARESIFDITSTTIKLLPTKANFSVQVRADRLLQHLIARSDHIGEIVNFSGDSINNTDIELSIMGWESGKSCFPLLAWSDSIKIKEVRYLLDVLAEEAAITRTSTVGSLSIVVSPKGYARFSEHNNQASYDQAFVAMWFNQSVDDAYEYGIEAALRDCGYRPMRIDRKEHINKIDDEIVAEIKRSKFVVADFTSEPDKPRGGVYFEAGYAMGMGIPVVWTCQEDLIGQVHFDTRQFNHIVWKDPAELAEKLKNRILATIGQGPIQK